MRKNQHADSVESQVFRNIEVLKQKLFAAEFRRLTNNIDTIVEMHDREMHTNLQGFIFDGEVHTHSKRTLIHKSYPTLAFGLVDKMEAWKRDNKQIRLDQDQIGQILFKLLNHAGWNLQHWRDALPECVVPLIPEFSKLERRNNQGSFLIVGDKRFMRDWERMLPKIQMYAVSCLIY